MPKVSDIQVVHITLNVGEDAVLFILLAADGSINRMGTGSANNTERDLFMGRVEEPLFARLLTHLNDQMLEHLGAYDLPDQKGRACKLAVGMAFANGDTNGFGFHYGLESQGPPQEIREFVLAAIKLTDPWFHEQKRMVGRTEARKPWWKFW